MAPTRNGSANGPSPLYNDDSSVESDLNFDGSNGSLDKVICSLDDISIASREALGLPMKRGTSFSDDCSVESNLPSQRMYFDGMENLNDVNDDDYDDDEDNKDFEIDIHESTLRRSNPLNGSCNSIKDVLKLGSIHENKQLHDSIVSLDSDLESDSSHSNDNHDDDDDDNDDESFADDGDYKKSQQKNYQDYKVPTGEQDEDEESVSDSVLINNILCRIDSKDHINGNGQRVIRTNNRTTPKSLRVAKSNPKTLRRGDSSTCSSCDDEESVSDSVLNGIINRVDSREHINSSGQRVIRTNSKSKPPKSDKKKVLSLDDRLAEARRLRAQRTGETKTNKNSDTVLDSLLVKNDSMDQMNANGQRVVKTKSTRTKKCPKVGDTRKKSLKDDPLMARFLNNYKKKGDTSSGSSSMMNSSMDGFGSIDSLKNVGGRGRRTVSTRHTSATAPQREGVVRSLLRA